MVIGGERKGTFFSPTILADIPEGASARHEEFFGPVASVYKVGSEDEAVKVANDTPFGLGSYVFTTDADQAERIADKIDAGMVYVNIVGADGAELPFGGVKRSGSGRELGKLRRRRVREQEAHPRRRLISAGGLPGAVTARAVAALGR